MKKLVLACLLSVSLCSCSLLQRKDHPEDDAAEVHDVEPGQDADTPLFDANGKEISNPQDAEVARLNTKVAALETKLDVMAASMERLQAQRSQPAMEAEAPHPQPSLAAPVDDAQEVNEPAGTTQISAAPAKPVSLPATMKSAVDAPATSGAEKEFRASMQLFQNGQNLEAASRFALMAKKYPNHLLASHALYWAGEASARAQQWPLAAENWGELEQRYPHSAYLPEALAGLARAYEAQGDVARGKQYRSLVLRAFPKSPVALRAEPAEAAPASAANLHRSSEEISAPDASAPAAAEETAPTYEGGGESEPPTESQ